MDRCFIFAFPSLQMEGNLQISRELEIYLAVEVIEIARPFTVEGDAVDPAILRLRFRALLRNL
jgi:hypothetical protein